MSQPAHRPAFAAALRGVALPVTLGLVASGIFFALVLAGPLKNDLLLRYAAGHWVSICSTTLFCVGLAALLLKALALRAEYAAFSALRLEPPEARRPPRQECDALFDQLAAAPRWVCHSLLGRRLDSALDFLSRHESARELEPELKALADQDADRQHGGHALTRILIWAMPMFGFLGTVIGITQALGDLGQQNIGGGSFQDATKGLLQGLYVAFDTTTQALLLSIGLMFIQFFVEQAETRLLEAVDARVADELLERFQVGDEAPTGELGQMQAMGEAVLRTVESLVQRQSELWLSTIDHAHQHWSRLGEAGGKQLQTALGAAISASLRDYGAALREVEQQRLGQLQSQWEQWQRVLANNAEALLRLQTGLVQQSQALGQVVQSVGEVTRLEDALQRNLGALAGAKNFEETVMSLAAAIHLLNARWGDGPRGADARGLARPSQERAA